MARRDGAVGSSGSKSRVVKVLSFLSHHNPMLGCQSYQADGSG
ncbi:MAG: hypothetical protein UX72_C0011G0048 [Parcubacteria group bacterium GW2011_GWA2_47_10]|nr:MAG: hypothetical protein UX72_C0011G0048 [Parcubacteria group bacterium GW2011_GWA2_47_10]